MVSNCVRDEIVIRVIRSRAGERCLLENKLHPVRARIVSRLLSKRDTAAECQLFLALTRYFVRPVTSLMNEIRLLRSDSGRERCVSGFLPQFPRRYADAEERKSFLYSVLGIL